MTESDWSSCTDPLARLKFLRGSPTAEDTGSGWKPRPQFDEPGTGRDRRFRLFACA